MNRIIENLALAFAFLVRNAKGCVRLKSRCSLISIPCLTIWIACLTFSIPATAQISPQTSLGSDLTDPLGTEQFEFSYPSSSTGIHNAILISNSEVPTNCVSKIVLQLQLREGDAADRIFTFEPAETQDWGLDPTITYQTEDDLLQVTMVTGDGFHLRAGALVTVRSWDQKTKIPVEVTLVAMDGIVVTVNDPWKQPCTSVVFLIDMNGNRVASYNPIDEDGYRRVLQMLPSGVYIRVDGEGKRLKDAKIARI